MEAPALYGGGALLIWETSSDRGFENGTSVAFLVAQYPVRLVLGEARTTSRLYRVSELLELSYVLLE